MNQHLCDICREPACDLNVGYEVKFGERYDDTFNGAKQPLICVSAGFSFHNLRSGFGGPPDLCGKCAHGLLEKLLAKFNNRAPMEPKSP